MRAGCVTQLVQWLSWHAQTPGSISNQHQLGMVTCTPVLVQEGGDRDPKLPSKQASKQTELKRTIKHRIISSWVCEAVSTSLSPMANSLPPLLFGCGESRGVSKGRILCPIIYAPGRMSLSIWLSFRGGIL